MLPLGLLRPGENGEIIEVRSRHGHGCRECRCGDGGKDDSRLEDLGLRLGKRVEMLSNAAGPVLLRVDESRIALARGLAMKIMVRKTG